MSSPRIALCFLTIDNLHPLMTMSFQNDFFQQHFVPILHPKFPEKLNHLLKPYCVPQHRLVKTGWGHISLVRATLVLFEEALKLQPPVDYLILMSETHIPLWSWSELWVKIKKEYEQNKGRMNVHRGSQDRWHSLRRPHFIPMNFFWKHSQWISMTRQMASFFTDPTHNYLNQYDRVIAPDEHYFANVLVRERFPIAHHFFETQTCYVKFIPGNNHPLTFSSISPQSIQMIKSHNFWFIRKVIPKTQLPQSFINYILQSTSTIPSPLKSSITQITPDEPQSIILDEPALITPDEPALITPDEPALITPDETESITPDESALITPDETESITTDETKSITPNEPALITPDEMESITFENDKQENDLSTFQEDESPKLREQLSLQELQQENMLLIKKTVKTNLLDKDMKPPTSIQNNSMKLPRTMRQHFIIYH